MKYIVLLYLLISHVGATELNLYQKYSVPYDRINGSSFPRNHKVLYRGIHPSQANYIRAIQAMLGDKNSNIESGLLYATKLRIMGEDYGSFLLTLSKVRSEFMAYDINSLVGGIEIKDERKAFQKAVEILSMAYENQFSKSQFRDHFISYSNPYRNDWPQGLMYSTLHIEVAKIYSKHILVFKENDYRSIDLNYWNKVNNDRWIGTNNEFPDKGEFLTPLYIDYSDVIGYQYGRNSKQRVWYIWESLQNDMDIAFYKVTKDNKDYVLIIDGRRDDGYFTQTVIQDNNTYYYANSTFNPSKKLPSYPTKHRNEVVNLLGIIEVCDSDCNTDIKKVFPEYEFRNNDLNNLIDVNILNQIKINGEEVYLHTRETIENYVPVELEVEEEEPEELEQTEQEATEKTEDESIKHTDYIEVIKSEPENTISDSILVCSQRLFSDPECKFKGDLLKLPPGKAIVFDIPEEYQGRDVVSVKIRHFQLANEQSEEDRTGWDSTPAYSSIQFFHGDKNDNDPWKFYGEKLENDLPKGSLFAEVVDSLRTALSENKYKYRGASQKLIFTDKKLKSNNTETILTDQLNIKAMRIKNVGVDHLYLHKVEIRLD